MRYILDVFRGAPGEAGTRQSFAFETDDPNATVADALERINERTPLLDASGSVAEPITWECSCLQRRCGACAMRVNGRPALACNARLSELGGETIALDPLSKFPLVRDLAVDRDAIYAGLERLGVWLENEVELPGRRAGVASEASRCLQCGLCLEVCPQFAAEGAFRGTSGMMAMTRLLAEAGKGERKRLAKSYRKQLFGGCAKSLACRDICPQELAIDELVSRSNAAAVWGRW